MPVSDNDRHLVRMALTRYYSLDPEIEIVDVLDDGHELVAFVRLPVLKICRLKAPLRRSQ